MYTNIHRPQAATKRVAVAAAMGLPRFSRTLILLLATCTLALRAGAQQGFTPKAMPATQKKQLCFMENIGQVTDQYRKPRPDIDYKLDAGGGLSIFLGSGHMSYQFARASEQQPRTAKQGIATADDLLADTARQLFAMYRMDVELVGANAHAQCVREQANDYSENYYTAAVTGNGSHTAHSWNKLTYKEVYPGIDWVLYVKEGQLKHEFVVRQGARVADIQLRYNGADRLALDKDGRLTAHTPQGDITEQAPYTYQAGNRMVGSRYRLNKNILSYETDGYQGDIVIDPSVAWATYYGGSGYDQVRSVVTDASGHGIMIGETTSPANIATTGAYQTTWAADYDIFIAMFSNSGARLWATYYGGTEADNAGFQNFVSAATGDIYITGGSKSAGMATPGAYQTTNLGAYDVIIARFSSSGAMLWSTYYGGTADEIGIGMGTDSWGNLYISGFTYSTTGIATPGSFQPSYAGNVDNFVVKFNSANQRVWGTYYGAIGKDQCNGVWVDGAGNTYLSGQTTSPTGLATTGAYQTSHSGGAAYDAFVGRIDSGGHLQWGTYYGDNTGMDGIAGMITDAAGNLYITGYTSSTANIATPGAQQEVYGGGMYDGFLAKFNAAGTRQWATYLGGEGQDELRPMAFDSLGYLYVAGYATSVSGIATPGAFQPANAGTFDNLIARYNSTGTLQWASYLGGNQNEAPGFQMAMTCAGDLLLGGGTMSTSGMATPGAFQETKADLTDAYLIKLQLIDLSITGTATVCAGATTTLACTGSGGVWSSAATGIATVDAATGIVTGIAAGTATVSYTISSSCGTQVASTVVTVNAATAAGSISGAATVSMGLTTTLGATVSGGSWSSSNTGVATISAAGVVTGVAAGAATISYTVAGICGSAYTTKTMTVNGVSGITGSLVLCVAGTTSLADAVGGGTWSSSNTGVATMSAAGVATGVAAGTATITYLAPGEYATAIVTVYAAPAAITGTSAVCEGAMATLACATSGGTWTSSNANATVSAAGVATGVAAGTAVISYTLAGGCGSAKVISVNAAPAAIGGALSACIGTTATMTNSVAGGVWSSPATAIVSVGSASGVATALSAGTAAITYTMPGTCRATTIFTVNAAPATITGATKACPGTTTTLACATTGGTWSSANTAIATADAATGIIAGVATGTVAISYSSGAGCVRTTIVTINSNPAAIAGTLAVCAGSTTALSDATTGGLSWSSSNTAVATIGATSGIATGVAGGTATITYTLGTGCTARATITVNALPPAITGTASLCPGSSTTLANAASGGAWSSANAAVATIGSATGIATGVAAGTSAITYTATTGCRATAVLTVTAGAGAISGTASACAGSTTTLSAAGTGTWSSSNTSIATVGATGITTGIAAGTASISYTLASGCYTTRTVTISAMPAANTGTAAVCVGATTTLANATTGGTWSGSNNAVLTVGAASGIVTGVGAATARVTYSLGSSCVAVTVVTVQAVPGAITGTLSVCEGAATTLANSSGPGTWSSANMAVGTIGSISAVHGRFAGIAAGTATVSYTFANGCARTVMVTVDAAPDAGTISSAGGFVINTSTPPTSVMLTSDGDAGGAWTSSTPAVATVNSSGLVAAAGGGTTNISYTVALGACTARATHTVSVLVARPAGSTTTGATATLYPNPNKGQFAIAATLPQPADGTATIAITNMLGQVLYQATATITTGTLQQHITLPYTTASGMYLLTIQTGTTNDVFSFVVE